MARSLYGFTTPCRLSLNPKKLLILGVDGYTIVGILSRQMSYTEPKYRLLMWNHSDRIFPPMLVYDIIALKHLATQSATSLEVIPGIKTQPIKLFLANYANFEIVRVMNSVYMYDLYSESRMDHIKG